MKKLINVSETHIEDLVWVKNASDSIWRPGILLEVGYYAKALVSMWNTSSLEIDHFDMAKPFRFTTASCLDSRLLDLQDRLGATPEEVIKE